MGDTSTKKICRSTPRAVVSYLSNGRRQLLQWWRRKILYRQGLVTCFTPQKYKNAIQPWLYSVFVHNYIYIYTYTYIYIEETPGGCLIGLSTKWWDSWNGCSNTKSLLSSSKRGTYRATLENESIQNLDSFYIDSLKLKRSNR